MTQKLFYEDPYLTDFSAQVLGIREEKGKTQILLNQTAFYPEGGGQPCDTGILGGVPVTDVQEKDGEIWHTVKSERPLPFREGENVSGTIDWKRRFDLMQQHSGEHILSGILHEMTGCENVGFHLTMENIYVDFNLPIEIETLREAETRANRYLWENHPAEISFPSPDQLKTLIYRSKKELSGSVRIVSFPGADTCACCGTHVAFSGEIGQIRVLTVQNWKGGVRVEIACGERALNLSRVWMEETLKVSRALSVKPESAFSAVERLSGELGSLKAKVAALKEASFSQIARQYSGKGDILLFEDDLLPDDLRRLANLLMETSGGRVALFSGNDQDGYKYALAQKDGDLRALTKELNSRLNGRGGGKPFFSQGSVTADRNAIETFFSGKENA